jgi:arsenate reductase (thioredoxin)
MTDRPSVLFVCVHNAGRSQMAAGFLRTLSGDSVEVRSAGTAPADTINPVVVEAMNEVGVDLSEQTPKVRDPAVAQASDVVVTMGCGDECPYFPGTTYLDWELSDPAGQDLAAIRAIRDEIRRRVLELLGTLRPTVAPKD